MCVLAFSHQPQTPGPSPAILKDTSRPALPTLQALCLLPLTPLCAFSPGSGIFPTSAVTSTLMLPTRTFLMNRSLPSVRNIPPSAYWALALDSTRHLTHPNQRSPKLMSWVPYFSPFPTLTLCRDFSDSSVSFNTCSSSCIPMPTINPSPEPIDCAAFPSWLGLSHCWFNSPVQVPRSPTSTSLLPLPELFC